MKTTRNPKANGVAGATAAALLIFAAALPAAAHHSFSSEFDAARRLVVAGPITKIEWTNPHVWIYLDVKDENGKLVNWGFETSAPILLIRRGVGKDYFKVGDVIKIEAYRAKDGSNNAAGAYMTFPDGKRFFTGAVGSPTDESPK